MHKATQMRVVSVYRADDVRVDMAEYPKIPRDDLLVRLRSCGVCGTDVHHIKDGASQLQREGSPMPIGHEASGEVIEVGGAVGGVSAGDRVIINPMATAAVIGNGGPEGAFSNFVLVRDAAQTRALLPIPEGVSYADAALAEPLAVSLRAANRALPQPGESALVFGARPIGLGIVLWLKREGVDNVVSADLSTERLELAKAMGTDHVVDARLGDGELKRQIIALHGETSVFGAKVSGTDMYFDATGADPVTSSMISLAKTHSCFIIVAMHGQPFPVDFSTFMSKEMMITGSVGYQGELSEALASLSGIKDQARSMVTDRYSFDEVLTGPPGAAESDRGKVTVEFPGTARA